LLLATAILLPLVLFFAWLAARQTGPGESVAQPVSVTPLEEKPRSAASIKPGDQRPATAPAALQTAAPRLKTRRILRYGEGPGELGVVRAPEMAPIGPESFALARNGNILVADPVNQRIQVYAADGTFLRSVELPGVSLNDVMTDAQDRFYVFDQDHHTLHQYDARGTPLGALQLDPADIDTRGYFHLVGDAVYFADAAVRDVLVATIQDGRLVLPDPSAERHTDGIHAGSGRVYSLSVTKWQNLQLQIRDAPGHSAAQHVSVAIPDIVSACYVGEDQSRRFYVQVERWIEDRVALEVLTFSAAGERLPALRLPENDYALWTTKLMDVATDGTIVQFLPQAEQAQINLFSQ
jgi:hypothetical protein